MATISKATERQIVYDTVETCFDLDGCTLDQAANMILETKERLAKKYPNYIEFSFDYHYSGYDGGYDINIVVRRFENDKENNARIKREQEEKEKKRAAKERSEQKARVVLMKTEANERKLLQELLERYPDMNESLTKQK